MSAADGTARATAAAVADGSLRAVDVVEASLERIAAREPQVGAFVEVFADAARRRAEQLDAERRKGSPPGPLAGVPIAIKDNLLLRGHRTSCGSRILDGFTAPYTATAVQRLLDAGAVPIGRTNMDEFGMGSSTEHSCFGPTRNPFDPACIPGGSSGGSAAAVAARMVAIALGSDTGGSIRQPAAMCGVAGLKPTYGRVSRFGLVAYASSLDTVGACATDLGDLALVTRVMSGVDPRDATSLDHAVADFDAPPSSLEGMRIGVPSEYFAEGLDPAVEQAVRAALDTLAAAGAEPVAVSLPHTEFAIPAYYLIATAEASSNLARYDGVRFGARSGGDADLEEMYTRTRTEHFGAEVQRRILLGCFGLQRGHAEQWYGKALAVRTLIRDELAAVFARCDALATPTSPVVAFALGDRLTDPLAMYLCDTLTVPASLAGIPALSVPCGFSTAGLPIGLQLMAPPLGEPTLLRIGTAFQSATDFHRREPAP
ncbi:MAG: Asp-tRNA(Asn)/Glu-tRNA(Gln) amidotransferase subunit GatA [Planctomycetes bacterium]|nr:Asp-tRNA(Asn)/Glu-tRNA(Gln) amidotransferase subunit GatA [Planctomycetota bacterium]